MALAHATRRGFLGSAAALIAGCNRDAPAPLTAFVGSDPDAAHRLRTGDFPSGPFAREVQTKIAIVGGGVAGLAAAWRLHRAGFDDFQIVELEPSLGGTARGGQLPRSAHPLGAHYLPSPHPECHALLLLLQDLGLVLGHDRHGHAEFAPSAIVAAPAERHQIGLRWHDGLYPDHGETAEEAAQTARWQAHLHELDARRGRDGRRLFRLPVDLSSAELRHLDGQTFAAYLDAHGWTHDRLRWSIDYACLDDYGCTAAQTSAFAGLHHFLARGVEDLRGGHTLSWPEGNARLIHGMAEVAEVADRSQLGTAVTAIDPDRGTLDLVTLATDVRTRITAEAIVWAAPRFVLPRVLPPGRDPLPANSLSYAPWLVASIELRRRPGGVGAPLAWDNVPVGASNLGYVVANHNEPRSDHRPGAVITYYEPLPGADLAELSAQRGRLLAGSLEQWAEHVRTALVAMHPGIASDIVQIHITRWGHAMIRPVPGLLFGKALATARTPVGRVRPCASDTAGLPLFEEAFYAGIRAAEASMHSLGHTTPSIVEG